ncbi:MAG: META domain-containing protein [Flavobacteriales bacterium]
MKTILFFTIIFLGLISCKTNSTNTDKTHTVWISGIKHQNNLNKEFLIYPFQDNLELQTKQWKYENYSISDLEIEFGMLYKTESVINHTNKSIKVIKVLEKTQDPSSRLHDIWGLFSINQKEINTKESPIKIELNLSSSKMMGHSYCNQINTDFYTAKNNIIFNKPSSTRMSCKSMEIENEFIASLPFANTFVVRKNQLVLFNKEGLELMVFKKLD